MSDSQATIEKFGMNELETFVRANGMTNVGSITSCGDVRLSLIVNEIYDTFSSVFCILGIRENTEIDFAT